MCFYLSENEPAKLATYLRRLAAAVPFKPQTASDRLADFTTVFGTDWRMLYAHLLRFMAEL